MPVAAQAAPAPAAPAATQAVAARPTVHHWPWMSIALAHKVTGRTLSYRYADAGYQYLVLKDGKPAVSTTSMVADIRFGDGTSSGANAGDLKCLTSGKVAPFHDVLPRATHTYAKPGRYTVTVTGTYCGMRKPSTVTRRYTITVR